MSQTKVTDSVRDTVGVAKGGTGLTAVGTSGNVLTSNGSAWASTAPAQGGKVLKVETFQTTTHSSGSITGTGGITDTIPQASEGHTCMSLAFTPTNASSTLLISATFFGAVSNDGNPWVGLFKDSGADAIAAWRTTNGDSNANTLGMYSFNYKESASSTSARTYTVKIGGASSGTAYFLGGQSSGRKLGGAGTGTIIIYEIGA